MAARLHVPCSCCVVLALPDLAVCAHTDFREVSDVFHDWSAKTPTPRKWKLTGLDARESGDVFWWERFFIRRESIPVMSEDAGHQVGETKKEKWAENELMTQYLRNKFRDDDRR